MENNTFTVEEIEFCCLLKNEGRCCPARAKNTCSLLTQIGSTSIPSDWSVFVKARLVLFRRRSPFSQPLYNRPPFEDTRLPITSHVSWGWWGEEGRRRSGEWSRAKGRACAQATHTKHGSQILKDALTHKQTPSNALGSPEWNINRSGRFRLRRACLRVKGLRTCV